MGKIDEVWYELDMHTQKYDAKVRQTEKSLKATGDVIKRYPVSATNDLNQSLVVLQKESSKAATAQGAVARASKTAGRSMSSVRYPANEVKQLTTAHDQLQRELNETSRANVGLDKSNSATVASMSTFAKTIGALGIAVSARELVQYADSWLSMSGRIALATSSHQEALEVQSKLFAMSQSTRSSFESTVELYSRMAQATQGQGISQQELLSMVETVNKAFIVSGASASEARGATIQLGQAMASGTLRGEELNSVLEQAPRLARAIATEMKVPVGHLRSMAAEGMITTDVLRRALGNAAADINKEFEVMPVTIAGAWTTVQNAIMKTVGDISHATTAGASLAGILQLTAKNFSLIVNAVGALAAVGAIRLFASLSERARIYVVRQGEMIRGSQMAAQAEATHASSLRRRADAEVQAAYTAMLKAKQDRSAAIIALESARQRDRATGTMRNQAAAAVQLQNAQRAVILAEAQLATVTATATTATARETAATRVLTASTSSLTRAKLALRAASANVVSFLGGPLGVALAAATAGYAVYAHNVKVAREESLRFAQAQKGGSVKEYDVLINHTQTKLDAAEKALTKLKTTRTEAGGYASAKSGGYVADSNTESIAAQEASIARLKDQIKLYNQSKEEAESAATALGDVGQQNEKAVIDQLSALIRAGRATKQEFERARVFVRQYEAEMTALSAKDTDESRKRRIAIAGYIDALTKQEQKENNIANKRDQSFQTFAQQVEAMKSSLTTSQVDNYATALAKLDEQAKKLNLTSAERAKYETDRAAIVELQAAKLGDAGAQFAKELESQLIRQVGSQADTLRLALEQFHDEIAKKRETGISVDQSLVDRLAAAQEHAIALADEAERFADVMRDTDESIEGTAPRVSALMEVLLERGKAEGDLAKAKAKYQAGDKKALKDIESAQGRLNTAKEKEQKLNELINAQNNRSATLISSLAGRISNAANAAFGLASAFSGVNSNITKMLGGIGNVTSGIKDISEIASKTQGGFSALFSSKNIAKILPGLGEIVGGGLSLGKAIFGTSPEEKERRRVQKENTYALQQLTKRVGELGLINVTGKEVSTFKTALNDKSVTGLLNKYGNSTFGMLTDHLSRTLGASLERMGLSYKDLDAFAQQFGITIDKTRIQFENVRAIIDAINAAELTQFSDTFSGAMESIQAEFRIFDISDPIDQLNKLRDVLSDPKFGAPALREALAGLDFSTAEGRERAKQAIERLFRSMQEGSLSVNGLGGLTAQDFLNSLYSVTDLLRESNVDDQGESKDYAVNRSITEITGSRIAGLLTSLLVVAREISDSSAAAKEILKNIGTERDIAEFLVSSQQINDRNALALQDVLSRLNPPRNGVQTPTHAEMDAYLSRGRESNQLTIHNLTLNIQAPTGSNPSELGSQVAESLVAELNRQLGADIRAQRVRQGKILH